MYLVAGLGNPGPRYVDTRHNVGFLVVDRLARRAMTEVDQERSGAKVAKARVADQPVVLAKPFTFMNCSGGPAQALAAFYKVPVDKVIVVHDDLDLPFGDVRVKQGGGHGGHNGLRDIASHLGRDHLRVRCGIGRPPAGWDTANYVLGRWTPEEADRLADVVETAADATEAILRDGAEAAMNRFNTRDRKTAAPPVGGAVPETGT